MAEPKSSPLYKPPVEGSDSGGSEPTPPNPADDPVLSMQWDAPPPFIGTAGTKPAPGAAPAAAPSPHSALMVNLGTMRSAEETMLTANRTMVDAYNALHEQVKAVVASPMFWGQEATTTTSGRSAATVVSQGDHIDTWVAENKPIREAAAKFAPIINPELTIALRQVADAIEISGAYMGRLNTAGQAYAIADFSSIMPAITPTPKA